MKEKYKHLLNFVANVLTLAMEALCFGWVWYVMYVPQLDKANTFFRRGNWAVIGMYVLFYKSIWRIPDRIYESVRYYSVTDTCRISCDDRVIF